MLIAGLMLLSVLAWYAIYRTYEREPHARQMSQLIVSVVNLTRSAIINAHPDKRRALLLDLSDREGIHIYPVEKNETIAALPNRPVLHLVAEKLRSELGPQTRLTLDRNDEHAVFVSFRIDDDTDSEYWVALPRERFERTFRWQWLGWGLAALLLSLGGAYLIMFRITRPLQALSSAALEIGRGHTPAPISTSGPSEITTLAHAFNQMSTDLARLDNDRALILAGISHDLRTPLTRLRMSIEMIAPDHASHANDAGRATHDGMIADIEEMNQTIGQFLDFAREADGEVPQKTDLAALIAELVAKYTRHGVAIETDMTQIPQPSISIRPQALRRAIANLIDNALRYAGKEQPLLIALRKVQQEIHIDICDRGPGIPQEEVERLKRPFTRREVARSNVSGAGLGLAIVERIARSHGGTLHLLAREGGGLVARICLPDAETRQS